MCVWCICECVYEHIGAELVCCGVSVNEPSIASVNSHVVIESVVGFGE